MSNYEIKNRLVVESIVQTLKKEKTIENELKVLLQINELLYNVFLIGKEHKEIIQGLLKNNILQSDVDGRLFVLPTTQIEKEEYLLSDMGMLLVNFLPTKSNKDMKIMMELISSLSQTRKFLPEEISVFLNFLFNSTNDSIDFDLKLNLYLILSESYHKMLVDKDITSMAILGQKTIWLMINNVYSLVNAHDKLNKIDKGKLTSLMRKFFFTIEKTIQNLNPN